jgi:MFS family permease
MNIKFKLTVLNFLEFAVWGAYLISMGGYLAKVGLGANIGLFYSVQGFVSLIMPTLMGIVADRFIQAQKVLSLCHLLAGTFMLLASFYCINSEGNVHFSILFRQETGWKYRGICGIRQKKSIQIIQRYGGSAP